MKKVRLLVWLVATAVLAAGVSVANAAQPPPVPAGAGAAGAKPLETDARTVFKGVFFAQGPVGRCCGRARWTPRAGTGWPRRS